MMIQRRIVAVPVVVLALGGILAGCPRPDARLEALAEMPCFVDADCDDANSCTQETCNATTSLCVVSVMDGVTLPQTEQDSCFERICQKGTEVKIPVPMGTSVVLQIPADCRKLLCDGAGNQTSVDDAADLPDDANDCTLDVCDGGSGENSALAIGTPCGQNGSLQCDGLGQCGGCTVDEQCSNGGNFCVIAICEANLNCGTMPKPAGTELPLAAQVPQDCRRQICDGFGYVVEAFDTQDGKDDGNDCTDDMCNAGMPMYQPTAAGVTCGGGGNKACDGLGNCRLKTSEPRSNDVECASGFCVDGVCCDANCTGTCQACSAAKKGSGQDGVCDSITAGMDPDDECSPQAVATCGTTGFCNGSGACAKYAAGTICNAASCGQSSVFEADKCDGSGICVNGATTPCGAGFYCVTGQCFAKKQNGVACVNAGECSSSNCVDGVCCTSSCWASCMACNVNGSLGTCKPAPFPTPDPSCSSNQVCNGSGDCKSANGKSCSSPNHCASGTCSGNVCKSTFGQPCAMNADCVTAMCINNVCQ